MIRRRPDRSRARSGAGRAADRTPLRGRRRARTTASRSACRASAAGSRRGSRDQVVAVVGATVDQALEPDQTLDDDDRFGGRDRVARRRASLRPLRRLADRSSRSPQQGATTADPDYRALAALPRRLRVAGRRQLRRRGLGLTVGRATGDPGGAVASRDAAAPGIGIDLIEIERVERALERRPRLAERLFTRGELESPRGPRPPRPPPRGPLRRQGGGDQGARAGGLRLREVEVTGGGARAAAAAAARRAAAAAAAARGSSSRSR